MILKANLSRLKKTRWTQYAVRFALGGAITVCAGLLADKFGPTVGGLFLAFPAIFPAGITLIEKTERQRKQNKNVHGSERARWAAILDASGAALGSIALMLFALLIWLTVDRYSAGLVLGGATVLWLGAAVWAWIVFRQWRHRARRSDRNTRARDVSRASMSETR